MRDEDSTLLDKLRRIAEAEAENISDAWSAVGRGDCCAAAIAIRSLSLLHSQRAHLIAAPEVTEALTETPTIFSRAIN
jgi:hypothetical protein